MKARDMDELLGTTARLAIVLTLADGRPWTFTELREETGLADGNLHVQTRKLVEARYLGAEKIPSGNRQVTAFRLTDQGKQKLGALARRLGAAIGSLGSGFGSQSSGWTASSSSGCSAKKKPGPDDSQVW